MSLFQNRKSLHFLLKPLNYLKTILNMKNLEISSEKIRLCILVLKTVKGMYDHQHDLIHLPRRILAELESIT